LVSQAVAADSVIDIYAATGMERPDISILSDEFLEEVSQLPQKNLKMELLRKLINDEIRSVSRTNVIQERKFSEMLESAINRYQNRALTTAEIIAELVAMAKELSDTKGRGEQLQLGDSELAFYDAVCQNDSAVMEIGDETLKTIARELIVAVRESTTIDWSLKESVRTGLRARVRRLLNKYDYPPDRQDRAVELEIEQAERLANDLAAWYRSGGGVGG